MQVHVDNSRGDAAKIAMNIEQVREQLHLLIDEVDDIYVLNGLYRNLSADKRQRDQYEKEKAKKAAKSSGSKQ